MISSTRAKGKQPSAIKEILTEALRDPESISKALASFGDGKDVSKGGMGDLLIHRAPDLTILKARFRRNSKVRRIIISCGQ